MSAIMSTLVDSLTSDCSAVYALSSLLSPNKLPLHPTMPANNANTAVGGFTCLTFATRASLSFQPHLLSYCCDKQLLAFRSSSSTKARVMG